MTISALRKITAALLLTCLTGCQGCVPDDPGATKSTAESDAADPTSTGADAPHPFADGIEGVITTEALPPDPPTRREVPKDLEATDVRTFTAQVDVNGRTLGITLEATPEVSDAQLEVLAATLVPVVYDPRKRKDMADFLEQPGPLQRGKPEVRLPTAPGPRGTRILFIPPESWEIVRPMVMRMKAVYAKQKPGKADGVDGDVGTSTQALTGSWDRVIGRVQCRPTSEPAVPLPFAQIEVAGQTVPVDAAGNFERTGPVTNVDRVRVIYEGRVRVPGPATTVTTHMVVTPSAPLLVMNEWHAHRSEHVDTPTGTTTGSTLDLGTITATSIDCELFHLGGLALLDFMTQTRSAPPAGKLRIKRWWGVHDGTPYAYHDYIVIALSFLEGGYSSRQVRRHAIFHEFGHSIRHVADGDSAHWGWDNFRWAYARTHNGTEVFNEQYAFNEGFAQYWRCTDAGATGCPRRRTGQPTIDFLDWNELHIGERLMDLANHPGVGHPNMVQILVSNPGSIHSLIEFERAYCQFVPLPNPECNADRTARRTRPSCPPGYNDDGATCRFLNIRAKDSYGRGVGTIPNGCGTQENDAGLCYNECRDGYDGVGPVCWKQCPSGFHDDGAFCRKDVHIFGSDNGSCPWYDICGLTFAAGCSSCPDGYHNDGCTCRRDAHIFAKDTYGRGVGSIPRDCPAGKEYDAGLCYVPCRDGFTGVGPVCWGRCDPGWDDHGATCYQPPNIFVKY